MATQKIKNLLSVSDALNSGNKRRVRDRSMSVEQKSHFLERFSTRDRKFSGASFNPGRRDTAHNDAFSNVSSTELKELYTDFNDSKSNMSNFGDHISAEKNAYRILHTLFEPYSTFIYIWSWIVITAIHYNSWVIIFRIAYPDAQRLHPAIWFSLDYSADLIYLIDILISSRISFLENGIYVNRVKRVSFRYFKSSKFLLDVVSLLPLDIFYVFYSVNPAFRLPRLIKFSKVFQAKKIVESMTNVPNLLRAVFWLHIMFLLMHYNSCFFFIISKYEGFGSNEWVYPAHTDANHTLVHRYIRCMYWSTLVLTAIGESNTPATTIECIYMIVCYITGIFIFATIVGQAGNVIQNMNASRMEFEKQRDNTMQYMKGHNVPSHLQKRVRLWYDYTYSRGRFSGGDDINEVTMLPDKMKTELALHVHLETLRKVSFLQKCQPEFLHDLVLKMKLHIFTPGDFIVRKGEIAREMYVISDGIAEVVSDTGRVLKVLHPGDFFGEIGLLSLSAELNRRTADVRSCGYLELFVLSKDDVMSSISDYPDAQKILAKHGRKRLVLGSKVATGPRDETTSSSSDSEIELKITRPDSDRRLETYFNGSPDQASDSKVDQPINEDRKLTPKNSINSDNNNNNNLISPRNGFLYLGTPMQSTISLSPLKRTASVTSQRNVIGPASSLISLDKTPSKFKLLSAQNIDSSDDNRTGICERLLNPKKPKMMRRSRSHMHRRRTRTIESSSRRSVFSDTDKKPSKNRRNSASSASSLDESYLFSNSTIANKYFEEYKPTGAEEKFLKSMKRSYLEMVYTLKKKLKTEIKTLKKRVWELEERNIENRHHEEELKKETAIKEKELQQTIIAHRQKEYELQLNEDRLKRQVEAMEVELSEYRKKFTHAENMST